MTTFEKIILVLTFCLAVFSAYNIGFMVPVSKSIDEQLDRYEQLNAEMANQITELDTAING
jgi:hypothetical protein